jgi:hypothetical protein
VTGHVTVPCFLTKGCATGGTMSYAKSKTGKFDSIPNQQGTMQALFICRIIFRINKIIVLRIGIGIC